MSEEHEPNFSICYICGEKTTVPEHCDTCDAPYCGSCAHSFFVECENCGKITCRKCMTYNNDEGILVCCKECFEEWMGK